MARPVKTRAVVVAAARAARVATVGLEPPGKNKTHPVRAGPAPITTSVGPPSATLVVAAAARTQKRVVVPRTEVVRVVRTPVREATVPRIAVVVAAAHGERPLVTVAPVSSSFGT